MNEEIIKACKKNMGDKLTKVKDWVSVDRGRPDIAVLDSKVVNAIVDYLTEDMAVALLLYEASIHADTIRRVTAQSFSNKIEEWTLDQVWEEQLKMSRYLSDNDTSIDSVEAQKKVYLYKVRKWKGKELFNDCFFCSYSSLHTSDTGDKCDACPPKLVDPVFNCLTPSYSFSTKPRKFYQHLCKLYATFLRKQHELNPQIDTLLTLDQVWEEQLKMSQYVANQQGAVGGLKEKYLQHRKWSGPVLRNNCFFCAYAEQQLKLAKDSIRALCSYCPGKKVEKGFSCLSEPLSFSSNRGPFLKNLIRLNAIRCSSSSKEEIKVPQQLAKKPLITKLQHQVISLKYSLKESRTQNKEIRVTLDHLFNHNRRLMREKSSLQRQLNKCRADCDSFSANAKAQDTALAEIVRSLDGLRTP